MYKICIISILLLVVSTTTALPLCNVISGCITSGQQCTGDMYGSKSFMLPPSSGSLICGYGLYCGANPAATTTKLSIEGEMGLQGSSFEPTYPMICQTIGNTGDPCSSQTKCLPGLSCYYSSSKTYGNCEEMGYAGIGEQCSLDLDCLNGPASTQCDPIKKVCVPLLTSNDIANLRQCVSNDQCPFNQYCNTTNYRCVAASQVGANCTSDYQCVGNSVCDINNNGFGQCTSFYSKAEGDTCSNQDITFNSLYGVQPYTTCNMALGLICNSTNKCTKYTPTPSTTNCTSNPCNNPGQESCICNPGTNTTGTCSSALEATTQCTASSKEFFQCAADNSCDVRNVNYVVPSSCAFRHCRSQYCQAQGDCIPTTGLSCFPSGKTYAQFGACQIQSNGSFLVPSTLIILIISILHLLF